MSQKLAIIVCWTIRSESSQCPLDCADIEHLLMLEGKLEHIAWLLKPLIFSDDQVSLILQGAESTFDNEVGRGSHRLMLGTLRARLYANAGHCPSQQLLSAFPPQSCCKRSDHAALNHYTRSD